MLIIDGQWRDDAERYIPSAPVILAGLKADLRPLFPTLKLAHLNEPDATSIGQVRLSQEISLSCGSNNDAY